MNQTRQTGVHTTIIVQTTSPFASVPPPSNMVGSASEISQPSELGQVPHILPLGGCSAIAANLQVPALWNCAPRQVPLSASSPDGRNTRGLRTGLVGFAIAITANSRLFNLSPKSGSGLPLCAQSLSLCDVAKQSSHLQVPADLPEKFIVNNVPFMTDHFLIPERAGWRLNAESYRTQPNPL